MRGALLWLLIIWNILHIQSKHVSHQSDHILQGIQNELTNQAKLHDSKCGNWMNEYANKHREILHSSKPKYLVAVPNLSGKS
jgi:hypothetical protein